MVETNLFAKQSRNRVADIENELPVTSRGGMDWEIDVDINTLLLFSLSVVSDSLTPHGLQGTRLHCPSPSPRACLNSCPLSW